MTGKRRFVVEADGGSRGNPGPAGYGALVRNAATGEVLHEVAEYIGRATNNVAEYRGLVAGLEAARAIDPDAAVEVRMDSKLVVEQMSGRWQIKHADMRALAQRARAVYPAGGVVYRWVPRSKNAHADRLANEALDAAAAGRPWQGAGRSPRSPSGKPEADDFRGEPEPDGASASVSFFAASGSSQGPESTARGRGSVTADRPSTASVSPDLGPPTTFVLLRHGSTALTPDRRFSGSGGDDPELSSLGQEQAAAVASALARWRRPGGGGIDAVVSSPLRRCAQTAAVAAARLGLEVRVDDGFRETDFGVWDGMSTPEVAERWPDELREWRADTSVAPPSGESFDDVARRVAVARDRTLARHPGDTVLVVSHVTPIKTLVCQALGAPLSAMFRMELTPVSVSVVDWYRDGHGTVRLFGNSPAYAGTSPTEP